MSTPKMAPASQETPSNKTCTLGTRCSEKIPQIINPMVVSCKEPINVSNASARPINSSMENVFLNPYVLIRTKNSMMKNSKYADQVVQKTQFHN